jgi:hypothetical protein
MQGFRTLVALLACALAACEPGGPPSTGAGGGDGGGGGGGGSGGGGGAPSGPPTLAITVDRAGAPPGVSTVDLELAAVTLFVDASAPALRPETPCDGGGVGTLLAATGTVPLDLGAGGETPLASTQVNGGSLREAWLVLRQGVLHRNGRTYKVHATALCTMSDGLQYTVVALRPGSPAALDAPGEHRLVATFDARQQLDTTRVACGASNAEECRTSDDPEDDGDPGTRLRYAFAPAFPARVEGP